MMTSCVSMLVCLFVSHAHALCAYPPSHRSNVAVLTSHVALWPPHQGEPGGHGCQIASKITTMTVDASRVKTAVNVGRRTQAQTVMMSMPNPMAAAKVAINVGVLGMVVALITSPVGILCFLLDCFGGFLKLAWRLAVFSAVVRAGGPFVMKRAGGLVMRVMMSGGPIKAFKGFLFGGLANVFGSVSSFFAGRGPLDGLAKLFGNMACWCDERMPSGGMGFDPSSLGNAGSSGGGGGLFGGLGDADAMASLLGGGSGLGGAGEDPMAGLADMFGSAAMGDGGSIDAGFAPPAPPVQLGSSTPGVKINIRKKGQPVDAAIVDAPEEEDP